MWAAVRAEWNLWFGGTELIRPSPKAQSEGWGKLFAGAAMGALLTYYAPGIFESLSGEPPVEITAGSNTERPGWNMVLPDPVEPEAAPPPNSECVEARAWGAEMGGVPVGETPLVVHLQGQRAGEVIIKTMRARILERLKPLSVARFTGCTGAGVGPVHGIGFDLDSPEPRAQTLDDDGGFSGSLFFEDTQVAVADGEAVAFNVIGRTEQSYIKWVIDVELIVDGEEVTITVEGDEFETSAQTDFEEEWGWGVPGGSPCCRLVRLD